MTVEIAREFFGWCIVINIGLLTGACLGFWLAHDWVFKIHGRMFKISVETFDSIHYAGIGAYKMGIFLFNVVPYLALLIIQ